MIRIFTDSYTWTKMKYEPKIKVDVMFIKQCLQYSVNWRMLLCLELLARSFSRCAATPVTREQ